MVAVGQDMLNILIVRYGYRVPEQKKGKAPVVTRTMESLEFHWAFMPS